MTAKLYDTDFYAWTLEQSRLLQSGNLQDLDIENLVEEIESLGRQEKRELENQLGVLIGYLLKWHYQPESCNKGWRISIRVQRKQVLKLLKENPSLKSYLPEAIASAHESGLALVVRETPLDYEDLPVECPFSLEQIFDLTFPEGV